MILKLSIEENWVQEWDKISQELIKRSMTFEEAMDLVCENCQDAYTEVDIEIDSECLVVCKNCAKQITNDKLNDPNFIGNIKITIL